MRLPAANKVRYILLILFLVSCAHIEPPHHGVVVDADTKQPIQDAVVHIDLLSGVLLPVAEGHTDWRASYETRTDERGTYRLPSKFNFRIPLEFFTENEITFLSSGYHPARIVKPSSRNLVEMHRIKYHIDFQCYNEDSSPCRIDSPFLDDKPELFKEYKDEVQKIKNMKEISESDPGVFVQIGETNLSKIYCNNNYWYPEDYKSSHTSGVNGMACMIFDENSKQRYGLNTQGNLETQDKISLLNEINNEYDFLSIDKNFMRVIFASKINIYVPHPYYTYNEKLITPVKGNISFLVGDNSELLTIEDNEKYVCYYSADKRIGKGCIESPDNRKNKFISFGNNEYYILYKIDKNYRVDKIFKNKFYSEYIGDVDSAGNEITDFEFYGDSLYLIIKNYGLKKMSFDKNDKIFKEDLAFTSNMGNFTKSINANNFSIGRAVTGRAIYLITGDSKVYRVSMDGHIDYQISHTTQ